jgi:hypothetical protein
VPASATVLWRPASWEYFACYSPATSIHLFPRPATTTHGSSQHATFSGFAINFTESECCLLVLNSVTSTLQWIRQPKPLDGVHNVCVFVCECVLGSSGASQSAPPLPSLTATQRVHPPHLSSSPGPPPCTSNMASLARGRASEGCCDSFLKVFSTNM